MPPTITYNALITPGYQHRYASAAFSANLANTTGYNYFNNPAAAGDIFYFGNSPRFDDIQVNIGTALAASTLAGVWEYYNGSTWAALTVTDPTSGFTVTGQNTVAFVPPDDWATVSINSVNVFWVRYRLTSISGQTSPAANSTNKDKVGENVIVAVGYTSGTPCTYAALAAAFPDVVVAMSSVAYKMRCRLRVGDGSTASYFRKNGDEYMEWMTFQVAWATVSLVDVQTAAEFQYGAVVDAAAKIGKNGGFDYFRGPAYQALGPLSGKTGVVKLYGAKFYAAQSLGFYVDTHYGGTGHQVYSCPFLGSAYIWPSNTDINRVDIPNGLTRGLSYPQGCTINDVVVDALQGVLVPSSGGSNIYVTNSKFLNTNGTTKFVAVFFSYSTADLFLVNCEVPSGIWTPSIDPACAKSQYRQHTLALHLTDQDGSNLSGATVTLKDREGQTVFSIATGADGKITFDGEDSSPVSNAVTHTRWWYSGGVQSDYRGPWTMTITADGYQDYQDTLVVDRQLDLEVAMSPPAAGGVGGLPTSLGLAPLGVKQIAV